MQNRRDQLRSNRLCETLRNKGYLCLDYLNGHCQCPHCPYMHVTNGEERPVPEAVCQFFAQGKCLRERCKYFHGAQSDLNALRLLGKTTYRPQDFMKAAIPPRAVRPADSGPQIPLPNIAPAVASSQNGTVPLPAVCEQLQLAAASVTNQTNTRNLPSTVGRYCPPQFGDAGFAQPSCVVPIAHPAAEYSTAFIGVGHAAALPPVVCLTTPPVFQFTFSA